MTKPKANATNFRTDKSRCIMKYLLMTSALIAMPALAENIYISNERSNDVTVLDRETMEVIDQFNVGPRPRGITISPDGSELYVCVSDEDTIKVFNPQTYEHTHNLPSGPDPELFVLNREGTILYVANEDDNMVTVIDVHSHQRLAEIPVGVEPEGMAVSPDGLYVVNTSETTNMAHFINTETHEIEYNVLVDQRPRYAEFLADGSKLYVSAEIGGTVAVIDPHAEGGPIITKTISFEIPGLTDEAIQPVGVRATKDGKYVFVALGPANRVAVIDATTDEVIDYILVGQRVWQLAFTPDEQILVTTNGNSNDITFIDVTALKAIKSVQVGEQPWGAVIAPN